jgi:dolichyl-diphosphooligosaccharide--protein glycosyltransferase
MFLAIKARGGGFHGIRKGIKIPHIFTFSCVAFLIIMPNAYMCLNYAVPIGGTYDKQEMFGRDWNAGGLSLYKERYWVDAFIWLNEQDTEIEEPYLRPGFISWWDYGFYEVAVGGHPTVADNFQSGIPCAANFQTSETEEEAISVLIVRLCEGDMQRTSGEILNGKLSPQVKTIFENYLGCCKKPGEKLIELLENPAEYSTSFGKPVAPEYGNTFYKIELENARYQDAVSLITGNLTLDEIVNMHREIEIATGTSIRYYGIEGYDMQIFNVFNFLSDKGTYGFATSEDHFFGTKWYGADGTEYTEEELANKSRVELEEINPSPSTIRKEPYFNTMVYRGYKGSRELELPGYGLKHFYPKYISPYPYPGTQYPAVVILEYHAGAIINGTITLGNKSVEVMPVVALDEFGIPHDFNISTIEGNYSVVVPPGNITLNFIVNDNTTIDLFFNETEGVLAPITEEEASRNVQYRRKIDVKVEDYL